MARLGLLKPMFFWVVVLFPLWGWGKEDPNELLRRVDQKLRPDSLEMFIRLDLQRPKGQQETFTFYSIKKGADRLALLVASPKRFQGIALLRQGQKIWVRYPGDISPSETRLDHAFFSGLLNNNDLLRADFHHEFLAEIEREESRGTWLKLTPRKPGTVYQRIRMLVNKRAIPLIVECYAPAHFLLKKLTFKEIRDFHMGWVRPGMLETRDPDNRYYGATLKWGSLRKRALPDHAFTLDFLPRMGSLLK
ncbi:outer membrane lipoprotein-sorting protein [Magnetococcales bacterium HHB-1]